MVHNCYQDAYMVSGGMQNNGLFSGCCIAKYNLSGIFLYVFKSRKQGLYHYTDSQIIGYESPHSRITKIMDSFVQIFIHFQIWPQCFYSWWYLEMHSCTSINLSIIVEIPWILLKTQFYTSTLSSSHAWQSVQYQSGQLCIRMEVNVMHPHGNEIFWEKIQFSVFL